MSRKEGSTWDLNAYCAFGISLRRQIEHLKALPRHGKTRSDTNPNGGRQRLWRHCRPRNIRGGGKALAQSLENNTILQHLRLGDNDIGNLLRSFTNRNGGFQSTVVQRRWRREHVTATHRRKLWCYCRIARNIRGGGGDVGSRAELGKYESCNV